MCHSLFTKQNKWLNAFQRTVIFNQENEHSGMCAHLKTTQSIKTSVKNTNLYICLLICIFVILHKMYLHKNVLLHNPSEGN